MNGLLHVYHEFAPVPFNSIFRRVRYVDKKTLLLLMSAAAVIFVAVLTVPAAFAQNQTNSTEQCPSYKYVLVDGVCKVDIKYNMGETLWNLYQEHQNSSSAGASNDSSSNGSTDGSVEQLVRVSVAFVSDHCSLPDDLGIVHKTSCSTYYERATMGVKIPVANLYTLAALDHVTGIYPDFGPEPDVLSESSSNLDDMLAITDNDITNTSNPTTSEDTLYYIIPVSIAVTVAIVAVILRTRRKGKIEA